MVLKSKWNGQYILFKVVGSQWNPEQVFSWVSQVLSAVGVGTAMPVPQPHGKGKAFSRRGSEEREAFLRWVLKTDQCVLEQATVTFSPGCVQPETAGLLTPTTKTRWPRPLSTHNKHAEVPGCRCSWYYSSRAHTSPHPSLSVCESLSFLYSLIILIRF